MKILIADSLASKGIEILRKEQDIEVDVNTKISRDELLKVIGEYHALIVRSRTKVTREVIEAGDCLKIIGRAGVGVDNVDVGAATRRGILVVNTPEGNTISAAEHTMSLILALSRNIALANASLKSRKWEREKFMGVELYNKTLGIIGLGRIGTEVAKRASAFGMNIIAADPYIAPEYAKRLNIRLADFSDILQNSDYISFHLTLTDDTYHLLGEKEFEQMKKGVRIVNTARGEICDEKALYNAIISGKVAGAALDVFEEEPPLNSKLLELDSVLATPHLAASTDQAQLNVAVEVAQQVLKALRGQPVNNAVNMPPMDPKEAEKLLPFINIAEKMGSFQSQLMEGHVTEVNVEYKGEINEYNTAIVSIAFQKGLVESSFGNTVNYINTPVIARERGIKLTETKSSEVGDFSNIISFTVKTDKGERHIAGTIFGTRDARIIRIDKYRVDVTPRGYILLVLSHHDKPGLMGALGTVLGNSNINIVTMSLAREYDDGDSMVIINLDNAIPEEVMKQIRTIEGISKAKLVNLR
ncbi:phosphoglycerate dehydrogenase [Candidatus Poribacteria bacterium]|nr:phosphoglycerate dehydrogenase [Candidatus Poribacteria bacterium]